MSTTNYLNLNKHDNVTTNENPFDIENYLNANWDKIDTKIQENTEGIKNNTDNIQSLQSQNTKLKANQIYGTATGTEIEITDSAETEASVKVSGESVQEAEPTPDSPSPIKNLTGNVECKVRGKNILDLSKCSRFLNCVLQDNGTIKSNILNTYYCGVVIAELNDFLLDHKGDIVTFIIDKSIQDKKLTIIIYGLRANGETCQESNSSKGSRTISITIANDFTAINSLELRWNRDSSAFSDTTTVIKDLMLCLGEGTVYEPYKETSVTFPLLEGQALRKDGYLEADDIHNARGQKVLDGTESWGIVNKAYYISVSDKKSRTELTKGKMLCSHFKETNATGYTSMAVGEFWENYYTTGNKNVFFNYDDGVGGVENWKAYLAEQYANGTPVILEYELEEPTTTPYTEEQQEAYDKLQNLILFKGYNYIEMTAENGVKANLEVNYIADTKTYIDTEIEKLKNAIISLGGVI